LAEDLPHVGRTHAAFNKTSRTVVKRDHIKQLRDAAARGQSASTGSGGGSPVPADGLDGLTYDTASNRVNTAGWQYDASGNQTRAMIAAGIWQRYEYDAANRLVTVKTDAGAVIASYTYCYSNARLTSQEGAARTYYAWGGPGVIAEYTEVDNTPSANSPQWSKSYVYLGGRLLATQQPVAGGERVEYHHPDRLGTRVVSNGADATYYEQTSLPFGTALNAESTGASNRRFTSYDRSTTTGLDYAVNRSYDPQQGRFSQVDPQKMGAANLTDPQTLNLYAYCGNDPVNSFDPSGLGIFSFFKKIFKGIAKILTNKWVLLAVGVALALLGGYMFYVAAHEVGEMASAALAAGIKLSVLSAALVTSAFHPGLQRALIFASGVLSFAQAGLSILSGGPIRGTPGFNPESASGVSSVSTFISKKKKLGYTRYRTAQQAAIAALRKYNRLSIKTNREYSGSICNDGAGYFYTPAEAGTSNSSADVPCPSGSTLAAGYHMHAAYDPTLDGGLGHDGNELYSPADINISNAHGVPEFLATPTRRLYRYDPATGQVADLSRFYGRTH
jgi:RHS repeat-associated protein